jgi:nucleotide-binding universal stress UspA family protein
MFNRIIVPVDGSPASWRAVSVGDQLAADCDAELELVYVGAAPTDPVIDRITDRIGKTDWRASAPTFTTLHGPHGAAQAIADHAGAINGSMVVMANSGRGRSEAVLGSVMTEVLALTFGPMIVVGPHVDTDGTFADELVVTVDGSDLSETAVGLAGAWGIGMHLRPWVVSVIEPGPPVADASESGYVAGVAHRLQARTGRDVEYEVLHGDNPARAIDLFAEDLGAKLIVMSTHGRGGMSRLMVGSVAADVIRRSRCPVVLLRPPELAYEHHSARTASTSNV